MCAVCGCGTTVVNQDGNYGTTNPYGITAPAVNNPTTLGEK
jgi:hypothetical protein